MPTSLFARQSIRGVKSRLPTTYYRQPVEVPKKERGIEEGMQDSFRCQGIETGPSKSYYGSMASRPRKWARTFIAYPRHEWSSAW